MNTAEWEPIRSEGRLVYWRRRLDDGGWLAVKWDGRTWTWRRYHPSLPIGDSWAGGYRSTAKLARKAADRDAADPDRYGPTDTCQTCDMPVRQCGHRTVELTRA